MIGQILQKLANSEKLNPVEMQQLVMWGNRTEENDSFVRTLQDGSGEINISKIKSYSGEFRIAPTGYTSKLISVSDTILDDTLTNLAFNDSYYDELGINPNGSSSIEIKLTGKYRFVIHGTANITPAPTSGYINCRLYGITFDGVLRENVYAPLAPYQDTTFQLVGEASILAGESFCVQVRQVSGDSAIIQVTLTITLVKDYDSEAFAT